MDTDSEDDRSDAEEFSQLAGDAEELGQLDDAEFDQAANALAAELGL